MLTLWSWVSSAWSTVKSHRIVCQSGLAQAECWKNIDYRNVRSWRPVFDSYRRENRRTGERLDRLIQSSCDWLGPRDM